MKQVVRVGEDGNVYFADTAGPNCFETVVKVPHWYHK